MARLFVAGCLTLASVNFLAAEVSAQDVQNLALMSESRIQSAARFLASNQSANVKQQASKTSANDSRKRKIVDVVAAHNLVGRRVLDSNLKQVGQLKYLMIRPDTGKVIYILIGSNGDLNSGKQFAAVPWESVETGKLSLGRYSPNVLLKVTQKQVTESKHWNFEKLLEVTDPAELTRAYEYYGVVPPSNADQDKPKSNLVVGQGTIYVPTLKAPLMATDNQIRGADVQTGLGSDLGIIDELVIDVYHGHVAYVLLARGGYLGSGQEWLAVPLQALKWSGTKDITVDLTAEDFKGLKGLDMTNDVPVWVRKKDLEELYRDFGVQPYWAS